MADQPIYAKCQLRVAVVPRFDAWTFCWDTAELLAEGSTLPAINIRDSALPRSLSPVTAKSGAIPCYRARPHGYVRPKVSIA
jgi:hypothetical protein